MSAHDTTGSTDGMKRVRLAVTAVCAGLALIGLATPVAAGTMVGGNTIGATGSVSSSGRIVVVTVFLGCEPGGSFTADVALTQGDSEGSGRIVEPCRGVSESHPVKVHAGGSDRFGPGPAQVCAVAVSRERGRVAETRQWCRADGVTLELAGADS